MVRPLAVLTLLLAVPLGFGQAPQPGEPIHLTVSAAAVTKPSLQYRLIPADHELTAGNAATLYYRAMAGMFENAALLKDIKEEHWDNWLAVPFAEFPKDEVGEKLNLARNLFHEIELGARCRDCDWQLEGRPEGLGLLLPEVQSYRRVGTVLAVRARYQMAHSNWPGALHTFQTGFGLARHMTRGPTGIHFLVGVAIAHRLCIQLDEFIQQPGAPNLYWALTLLPRPFGDPAPALRDDRTSLERMFPMLKQLEQGPMTAVQVRSHLDRLRAILDDFGLRRPTPEEDTARALLFAGASSEARRALIDQGLPADDVKAMPAEQVVALRVYRQYREAFDEVVKWTHVPDGFRHPDYKRSLAQYQQAVRSLDRFFFRGLLQALSEGNQSPFEGVFNSVGRLDRRLAALRTIEALRDYAANHAAKWPAALQDVKDLPPVPDPVTGKPFEYEAKGDRATLTAPLPPGPKPAAPFLLTYRLALRR
jgi:hypothetical protein